MSTMTKTQADRIVARTATIVARMRADANALEARGERTAADAIRRVADSRERAGMRAREGARIGRV